MQNVYFEKLKEVILIPLTVELYFVIQHVNFLRDSCLSVLFF